ncbi:response regulator [Flavobacterium sp. CYK-55]|uniref:LytR/AlgR family response regulator transcription factor n=1 Tax=Flavobacterium sp. CYK-55 TaxID=2835529 RepID=UPI001BCEC85A|nr:response regulator [Flavobacterium sp. CYK-55]MBS7787399.1 response regulator [Flavobacterium sp. CYK-55]
MVKILIVEDELIIAEDVRSMLCKMGYEVLGVAMDYHEAIHLLKSTTPDLILLDVNLNGSLDGIDLAHEISKIYKIPFIYTTSYADTPTLERAKATHPINYLVKPFKQEQLLTTIEMALHQLAALENASIVSEPKADSFIIKDALFIKDKFKYTKLNIHEILWIKSDGNYLEIKTLHKDELIRATLSNFIERLNSQVFFKTHKSYIVNLDYMTNLEHNFVTIQQTKIPIAKNYYDILVEKLNIV